MHPRFGMALLAMATMIALINFYLSYIRAPLHWWRGKEFRNISGVPLFGNLFMVIGLACVERSTLVWAWSGVLVLLDTGGIGWFIVIMAWMSWREQKS